ncbi:hypothetical protein AXF42_Ash002711 [Apostasia shenzhenica]|uniref:Uncharacterized protein n=1 Tax=Apostasia shenzhenica TaxID=1088818 RepID=A0A2I0A726_9ASPA|nr:hypothetical protein AXF42_Ash002711 [Apostasia shenzhenica]
MEGSPWSFDQHIPLLKKLSGDERPSEVNLHCSPFWIHLIDLPMGLMMKQMATKLGQQLSEALEVDEDQKTAKWGKDLKTAKWGKDLRV